MIWFVLAISIYCFFLSFEMKTVGVGYTFLYKLTPFVLGLGTMLYFLITMGIL